MKLIFLGPPGAGKGTQADFVAEHFGIAHISTGDMLRTEMRNGTPLGKQAKGYVDRGELVPDGVILAMVKERISAPDCANGFLLDGFPRTVAQADALKTFCRIDRVIDIDVPSERLIGRICGRRMCPDCGTAYHVSVYQAETCEKCGGKLYQRDDDREETVKNRLNVYRSKTQPLIDYYTAEGNLISVNGDRGIETVKAEIFRILEA